MPCRSSPGRCCRDSGRLGCDRRQGVPGRSHGGIKALSAAYGASLSAQGQPRSRRDGKIPAEWSSNWPRRRSNQAADESRSDLSGRPQLPEAGPGLVRADPRELDGGRRPLPEHGSSSGAAAGRSAQACGMTSAPVFPRMFARVNLPKARQAWKACGQSLLALFCGFGFGAWIDHEPSHTFRARRSANMPARRRCDKQGLRCGGPAWPRRGAVSALRGRIRNKEKRNHAYGFDRRASNPNPNLDIPDRNCRINGTLLSTGRFSTPRTAYAARSGATAFQSRAGAGSSSSAPIIRRRCAPVGGSFEGARRTGGSTGAISGDPRVSTGRQRPSTGCRAAPCGAALET